MAASCTRSLKIEYFFFIKKKLPIFKMFEVRNIREGGKVACELHGFQEEEVSANKKIFS